MHRADFEHRKKVVYRDYGRAYTKYVSCLGIGHFKSDPVQSVRRQQPGVRAIEGPTRVINVSSKTLLEAAGQATEKRGFKKLHEPDYGVPDHLVEVGNGVPAEIVELFPQQLALPTSQCKGGGGEGALGVRFSITTVFLRSWLYTYVLS